MNQILITLTAFSITLSIVAMLLYRYRIYSDSSHAIRTAKTPAARKYQADLAKSALSIPPLRVDIQFRLSLKDDGDYS